MTASLAIELCAEPIERVRADLAVAPFFSDDRPLRGSAGRADWRLCGRLSELVAGGRLSGAAGEAALVTTRGALRAPLLLVLGLGPREAGGAEAAADATRGAIARSLALGVSCLALPADELCPGISPLRSRVEAVALGAARAVAEQGAEVRLRWVAAPGDLARIGDALRRVQPRGLPARVALRLPDPPTRRRVSTRAAAAPGSLLA